MANNKVSNNPRLNTDSFIFANGCLFVTLFQDPTAQRSILNWITRYKYVKRLNLLAIDNTR